MTKHFIFSVLPVDPPLRVDPLLVPVLIDEVEYPESEEYVHRDDESDVDCSADADFGYCSSFTYVCTQLTYVVYNVLSYTYICIHNYVSMTYFKNSS